jgi:O-antigen/teichoic acid export membrane protein
MEYMSHSAVPIPIDDTPEALALTESGTRREVLAEASAAAQVLDYAPPPQPSLKARTVRSSLWTLFGFGSSQIIRFASNLILTRLLIPHDFGLAAIVGMFVNMFQQLSDIGLGPAIIQNPRGDEPRFLNTAWTIAVTRGVALWALGCAIAWPVARFYHEPILMKLIIVTGFNGVLMGLNSTAIFQLNRHLALGKITVLNTASQLVTTIGILAIAFYSHNVWAIILGGLAGNVFTLAASHMLIPGFRNRFAWDRSAARELFHFGGWVFASTAMTFFANEVDRLIFGKIASVVVLGVYQQAATLVRMPMELIARLAHMNLYPALARSAELGRDELARKLRMARGVILPLGIAAVVGLAFGAPLAVWILYPQKFGDAGWMAQFMSAGLWLTILQASAERTLPAMGNQRPLALANFVNMAATIGFAFLGHHVGKRYGTTAAVEGFILGVAAGNLGGHLVVQASLAMRGVSIYRQDFLYSAMLAIVFACGVIVPRALGPMMSPRAAHALAVTWHLTVIAVTSVWASLRMLRRTK